MTELSEVDGNILRRTLKGRTLKGLALADSIMRRIRPGVTLLEFGS
jgi:hypothetical protein